MKHIASMWATMEAIAPLHVTSEGRESYRRMFLTGAIMMHSIHAEVAEAPTEEEALQILKELQDEVDEIIEGFKSDTRKLLEG